MKQKLVVLIGSLVFAFAGFGAVGTVVVATSIVSMQDAIADNVSCSTTSWGSTNCSGPGGTTSCSTTSWGSTNCSGSKGTTSCSTTSWGSTNCSGTNGSTSCSTTSWGSTNCSGTNGSYSCSTTSWGSTNCSGNGITYIPKPTPTPTPTKTYVYTNPTPTPTKTYVYTNPTPTPTKTYVYTNPTPTPTPTKTYTYTNPTPSQSAQATTSTQVCVTSLGLSESCSAYPRFFIEYCSAQPGGTLQWLSSSTWTKLWDLTGVKNSRCTSLSNPYYVAIQGDLQSKVGISLRVIKNAVNGVTPASDLFTVKLK